LINGEPPPASMRFSIERKLVAQLSQNMNFVMDLSVGEFIEMHAESRMVGGVTEKKERILAEANKLAGEPLMAETPVTALSGGQSRALMIADTAFLSASPIVLIDEIENAGIDRRTAVELLIRREKIVVIATHDPVLALMADRRIVIRNGGIYRVLETTEREKAFLNELEEINGRLMACRERLRNGERLPPEETED
jgi:ABC-type lipoprotein export system ATPase subunit